MGYITRGNKIVIYDLDSDIIIWSGTIVDTKSFPNICQLEIIFKSTKQALSVAWPISMKDSVVLDGSGSFRTGNISIHIEDDCNLVVLNKCLHPNKKNVRLISSAYVYCPDCKADLGDC